MRTHRCKNLLFFILFCHIVYVFAIGNARYGKYGKHGSASTAVKAVDFADYEDCFNPVKKPLNQDNVFPRLDNELIEMEMHVTHVADNLTYWTKTSLDTTNSHGMVEMDFQGNRETYAFDLIKKQAFRMFGISGNQTCVEESLEKTSCNPLGYFVLRTANKTLDACDFHATTPVRDIASNFEYVRWGLSFRKWKQCIRFQQGQTSFLYLVKYFFRPATFSYVNRTSKILLYSCGEHADSGVLGKYTPVRLEVTMLYPDSQSDRSRTQNLVIFDFISFLSRPKDNSTSQMIPYTSTCLARNRFNYKSVSSFSSTTKTRSTHKQG